MTKQEIIFGKPSLKKHSIRYFAIEEKAAIESIYVKNEYLGTPPPKQIKMTLEEVE